MIGDDQNGLLYEPQNEAMLADRLLELFSDAELYDKVSTNARRYIFQNNLLWTETGKQYASLYRKLAMAV